MAVRCEDDTAIIDHCGGRGEKPGSKNKLSVQIFKNGDLADGFKVIEMKNGLQYEVSKIV